MRLLVVSRMNSAILTVLASKHVQYNIRAITPMFRGFYLADELGNFCSGIGPRLQFFMSGSVEHPCLRGLRRESVDGVHFTGKMPCSSVRQRIPPSLTQVSGSGWTGECSVSNRTCRKTARLYTINSKKRLRSNRG